MYETVSFSVEWIPGKAKSNRRIQLLHWVNNVQRITIVCSDHECHRQVHSYNRKALRGR
jgi:hypothetical protein